MIITQASLRTQHAVGEKLEDMIKCNLEYVYYKDNSIIPPKKNWGGAPKTFIEFTVSRYCTEAMMQELYDQANF